MNRSLASRAEKSALLDFLRRILQELLFKTLDQSTKESLLNYLAWMRDQPDSLFIRTDCKTGAGVGSIRIVIEAGFDDSEGKVRQ